MPEYVLVTDRGPCRVLTINRPEVRNALHVPAAQELERLLRDAVADDSVAAVVLAGAGGVFCSGMDLKYAAEHGLAGIVSEDGGFAGLAMREAYEKVIIAAVEGPARAGGFELALACDMIVAAEGATFGLPEVRRGLVAVPGVLRLARAVPRNAALSIAVTGEPVTAQRAYDLGLVARLTPDGAAVDGAVALAEAVLAASGPAVAATKEIVATTANLAWDEAAQVAKRIVRSGLGQPHEMNLDGVRAFAKGEAR